ncbi:MAG TPA: hypothetical protein ENK18_28530 [Deltaproteobacteria bacterium]|nr:hypothetical protein [Deltaproteobacteria bacterium]
MLSTWLGLAVAAPEVEGLDVPRVPLSQRLASDDASLVLLYGGEQRGETEPCGCALAPLGGLARATTYAEAVRAAAPDTPALLLNAGAWLSNTSLGLQLLDETHEANARVHAALRVHPWDVLNVTFRDWPDVASGPRPGLVSANTHAPDIPVVRYRLLSAGEHTVAITGVTRVGLPHLQPPGLSAQPPVEALEALLPELQHRADVVVVLIYDLPREARTIAGLPGVDVVIEAGGYHARWGPWVEGEAVWVRTWEATPRLGELRLWIEAGSVVRALERTIDLDSSLDAALTRPGRLR